MAIPELFISAMRTVFRHCIHRESAKDARTAEPSITGPLRGLVAFDLNFLK